MPLIDRYVAVPDFRKRHTTTVNAREDIVLAKAGAFKTEDDLFFRRMIALRELPMRAHRAIFGRNGSAKLALNFAVHPDGAGRTILWTEKRIICSDTSARLSFAPYWYLIRPVSGLIRRRTLAAIRKSSEAESRV